MADELIDILNNKGELTGEVQLKSKAHENGLWHASAQIWIFTGEGNVLLQKRAFDKETYPGLWDISVAGHLSVNDTPFSAAIREIEEEIGVVITVKDLIYLKAVKREKRPNKEIIDKEFNHLFLVKKDICLTDITLQKEEVASVRFSHIDDFSREVVDQNDIFVPHGLEYYGYIISEIRKHLK